MATQGRKPFTDRPIRTVVYIPQSIAVRIDLELMDGARLRREYGKTSALITQLLREHFKKQDLMQKPSSPYDIEENANVD